MTGIHINMPKNPNSKIVMSIAVRPHLRPQLKDFAQRRGVSISELVGDLIEQVLRLNVEDDVLVVAAPEVEPQENVLFGSLKIAATDSM